MRHMFTREFYTPKGAAKVVVEKAEAIMSAPAATEPTQAGLQYVIPGCEKDQSRGPTQMSLF